MSAVLVSHPHAAAVSVGMASGFARAGALATFATGLAVREEGLAGRAMRQLSRRRPVLANRILRDIPEGRLLAMPLVELGARLAASLVPKIGRYNALFISHDVALARLPWPRETTAVYAYEDAALHTFRRARRAGMGRIWDLPLPHYLTIEALWRREAERWPGAIDFAPHSEPPWKRERKDQELALASTISVASAFTKQSLEARDIATPIVVAPYGFPVEDFAPRSVPPSGKFTVLSVGTHDLRKGTPYLLEAWKRAAIPDAELHLCGPMRLAKSFVDRYAGGSVRHWPHVPKMELPARYAAADVLAFPTLGDGFGLVIQEAMCTGTPVITTPCGGGPECITNDVDGWLVPPADVDALVEKLRDCAANRDRVFQIGQSARRRAERWTWADAVNADVLEAVMGTAGR